MIKYMLCVVLTIIYAAIELGVLLGSTSLINAHTSDNGLRVLCGVGVGWCVGTSFMVACISSYERIWRR